MIGYRNIVAGLQCAVLTGVAQKRLRERASGQEIQPLVLRVHKSVASPKEVVGVVALEYGTVQEWRGVNCIVLRRKRWRVVDIIESCKVVHQERVEISAKFWLLAEANGGFKSGELGRIRHWHITHVKRRVVALLRIVMGSLAQFIGVWHTTGPILTR